MGEPSHEATTTAPSDEGAPSGTDVPSDDGTRSDEGTPGDTDVRSDAATRGDHAEELTGAAAMFANDRASQHLGITVDDHGPGWARCSMTITGIMTNGHSITHGGYIFLFADTTFAMACNYPGSITVASGGDIDFLKSTYIGDELVAHGREVVKQGRSGVYDIEVTRGEEIVAVYRGRSRTLPAPKPTTADASEPPKPTSP